MFTDSYISIAGLPDIHALVALLNKAYRGEASRKGWTSESHIIDGDVRTDEDALKEVFAKEGSVLLKYENDNKELIGCVNLQEHGNKMYLGMFAVDPLLQGSGIGKRLLRVSEEYAHNIGCTSVYMTVISVRAELINWYKRHGYIETGETQPFHNDGRTGKHLQALEFLVLEKAV